MALPELKKNPTANFLHARAVRAQIAEQVGGNNAAVINEAISKRWATLSPEEQAPFRNEAARLKSEFKSARKQQRPLQRKLSRKLEKVLNRKFMRKHAKKNKDPFAPKKPAGGGFGVFVAKMRPDIIAAGAPEGGGGKCWPVRVASEKWKALSDSDKQVYSLEFLAKLAEYKAAMADYKPPETGEGEDERKQAKTKRDKDHPTAPKKPAGGGFGVFTADMRPDIMAAGAPEGGGGKCWPVRVASERWKALSDPEKQVYSDEFQTKMVEYKAAMAVYTHSETADEGEEEGQGERATTKRDKDPTNAPKKPAGGGFGVFMAKMRPEIMAVGAPEGGGGKCWPVRVASEKWKALSDLEKQVHSDEFQAKMVEYRAAMALLGSPAKKKTKASATCAVVLATTALSKLMSHPSIVAKGVSEDIARDALEACKGVIHGSKGARARLLDHGPGSEPHGRPCAVVLETTALSKLMSHPSIVAKGVSEDVARDALEACEGVIHGSKGARARLLRETCLSPIAEMNLQAICDELEKETDDVVDWSEALGESATGVDEGVE